MHSSVFDTAQLMALENAFKETIPQEIVLGVVECEMRVTDRTALIWIYLRNLPRQEKRRKASS